VILSSVIKSVIEHYIPITKAGSNYKTCCPFHNEKTPSLNIVESKQFFYCFGCGASGDVFEFVKRIENINFPSAVDRVVEITGLTKEEIMQEKEITKSNKDPDPIPLDLEFIREFINNTGYRSNGYRGIRDEINKFYGHLTKLDAKGNVVARYYPETFNNKVTGYKCRNHPKDFSHGKIGDTGSRCQLSGQIKFKSPSKYVLYVGGEEDKAAAYQMLSDCAGDGFNGIPVVSPTAGENSAAKQAKEQYEWFDMYDIIVIGMDNDAAGVKAAKEIAEVLPKDKVRIAKWSGKDPNQMLQDGLQKQFVRDFYNAKEYSPSGIENSTEAEKGITEFLTAEKITLPPQLHRLQTNMRGGIRSTGAIVNIIGDTSIGKTFISDTMVYYWLFNSPITPTIVSLERSKEELLIDLLSLHLKKNLLWFTDGHDAVEYLDRNDVKALKENLLVKENGEPRFFVIDERKGDIDVLMKQMEKSSKMNDSKLIIIDPLTDFLRALGNDVQDNFFMWQKLQKKNGLVFINILHTRKPPTDKEGKVRKVTEYDALGSGTFVQSADINIVLNRDKMASDPIERNTTYLDMPKCRGGITGEVGALYYDHETRQQYDKEDYFLRN
jgi:archaellum biogenesis ATPase FlaH